MAAMGKHLPGDQLIDLPILCEKNAKGRAGSLASFPFFGGFAAGRFGEGLLNGLP